MIRRQESTVLASAWQITILASAQEYMIDMWGGHGSDDGQFAHMAHHGGMMGIAIGPHGNVFITDQGNFRVQVFAQDGTFRSKFGTRGRGDGQFLKPN